jgi:hypothetical protein
LTKLVFDAVDVGDDKGLANLKKLPALEALPKSIVGLEY